MKNGRSEKIEVSIAVVGVAGGEEALVLHLGGEPGIPLNPQVKQELHRVGTEPVEGMGGGEGGGVSL